MSVRGGLEGGEKRWGKRDRGGRRRSEKRGRGKSMLSLINSHSPCLHGGLSLLLFFSFHSNIFFSSPLPLFWSLRALLLPSPIFLFCSTLIFSLSLSLCNSMLSALSSEPSHFLPFQPFSFLSSTYSPISLPYREFSLCVASLSSKYCAIKWLENRLPLTVDLMRSLKIRVHCGHRSVWRQAQWVGCYNTAWGISMM